MKRKVTQLETTLIKDGYYLLVKKYCGKGSCKTLCYEYIKKDQESGYDLVIVLDRTRTKIDKFGVANVYLMLLDQEQLKIVHNVYLALKTYIETLPHEREMPKELLESEE